MRVDSSNQQTRPLFRLMADMSCPFFFLTAIATAFPQLCGENGEPSFFLTVLLLWGGVLFATIASTGRLKK